MSDQSEDGYPLVEVDGIGDEKAIWDFCGKFPLAEIVKGRRACRAGWRNTINDQFYCMCSVVVDNDGSLFMERESEEYIELSLGTLFCDANDMLAEDWYLERLPVTDID